MIKRLSIRFSLPPPSLFLLLSLSLSLSFSLSLSHLSDKILTRRSGQISLARATSGPLAKPLIGPIKRAPSQHGVSRARTSPTQYAGEIHESRTPLRAEQCDHSGTSI